MATQRSCMSLVTPQIGGVNLDKKMEISPIKWASNIPSSSQAAENNVVDFSIYDEFKDNTYKEFDIHDLEDKINEEPANDINVYFESTITLPRAKWLCYKDIHVNYSE